jgi:hypothetical protein
LTRAARQRAKRGDDHLESSLETMRLRDPPRLEFRRAITEVASCNACGEATVTFLAGTPWCDYCAASVGKTASVNFVPSNERVRT